MHNAVVASPSFLLHLGWGYGCRPYRGGASRTPMARTPSVPLAVPPLTRADTKSVPHPYPKSGGTRTPFSEGYPYPLSVPLAGDNVGTAQGPNADNVVPALRAISGPSTVHGHV